MYPIKFSTCPMSVRARSARWCSRFKSTTSAHGGRGAAPTLRPRSLSTAGACNGGCSKWAPPGGMAEHGMASHPHLHAAPAAAYPARQLPPPSSAALAAGPADWACVTSVEWRRETTARDGPDAMTPPNLAPMHCAFPMCTPAAMPPAGSAAASCRCPPSTLPLTCGPPPMAASTRPKNERCGVRPDASWSMDAERLLWIAAVEQHMARAWRQAWRAMTGSRGRVSPSIRTSTVARISCCCCMQARHHQQQLPTCTSISCCIAAMLRFFWAIASSVCRSCDSIADISALPEGEWAGTCRRGGFTGDGMCVRLGRAVCQGWAGRTCSNVCRRSHAGWRSFVQPPGPHAPQPHFSTGRMNREM